MAESGSGQQGMKVHPGADRGKNSIPVRRHALHALSGRRMPFSRVEPRIPSSLYGTEVFHYGEVEKERLWGLSVISEKRSK